jgi:hypothetical protein
LHEPGPTVPKIATPPPRRASYSHMLDRRIVFALFAAALLASMVREWSAPVACLRVMLTR